MKSIAGLVGGSLVGFAGICGICQPPAEAAVVSSAVTAANAAQRAVFADLEKVTLAIDGMTCGGCAISARLVLKKLDGVEEADVDYEKKRAIVTYDPSKVTPEKMIEALKTSLKYTATVVRDTVR